MSELQEIYHDAEEFVDAFIEECDEGQPVDGFEEFSNKIKAILKKIRFLDRTLEESKKAAKKELLSLMSPQIENGLNNFGLNVLADSKKYVESCFTEEAKGLF